MKAQNSSFKEKMTKVDAINLLEWVSYTSASDENLRDVFLNMDRAMKYVHDRGYCIKSFDPREIEILNYSVNQIRFKTLLEMPKDYTYRKELKQEDIFNSSCLQIGLYTHSLPYLKKEFLKSNFEEFAKSLPADDVPYYRGVIERGATIYLCEWDLEKRKRDLEKLDQEVSGGEGKGRQLVKSNGLSTLDPSAVNDKINDKIYKQLNSITDAAFISFLIFPTMLLVLGIVALIIMWVVKLG